ncbi:hypothetical protein [Paenisporosarcina sp. OV554]|uniref:hypothetical protein n=1 Tax=Paenisporosarcina sp. OV554 TaxID=2135694 RepID=UPI001304AAD5|nr:hypothetical protein [Paenisporosarcina sp. OV554]
MSKLQIINWNVAIKGSIEEKMNYLQTVINETNEITIVALQEVTEKDREYNTSQRMFST